jgi:DNA-directed RNA polymerase subunit M/transcription elongation factor TFIIS
MEFCKNCGSILFYFKEKGETKVYCKKCKNAKTSTGGSSFSEIRKKIEIGRGFIESGNPSANYNHICKKCGHVGVEIIDVGILVSDEDNLILLKCGKCGFSERVGKKTT